MMSLDERLDKAEEMIQKPSFRENKGLSCLEECLSRTLILFGQAEN